MNYLSGKDEDVVVIPDIEAEDYLYAVMGQYSDVENPFIVHNIRMIYTVRVKGKLSGVSAITEREGELYMWGFRDKTAEATPYQYFHAGRDIISRYNKINIITRQSERYVILLCKRLGLKKVNQFLDFIHFRKE